MRNLDRGTELKDKAAESALEIETVQMDVNDEVSVKACVADVLGREGRIDVLVNNAGIGPMGPIEETEDAAAKAVFETNFFGALRCIRAVLPSMRQQRSGVIVNVSSVAGRVAPGCMGIYCASKFALEAASESLAHELVPYNIRVALIEPGFILTPILAGAVNSLAVPNGTAYPNAVERTAVMFTQAQQIGDSPIMAAETIERAITDPDPKLRYHVGDGASVFIDGRARMSDEEWIAMGRHESLEDYFGEFATRFPM